MIAQRDSGATVILSGAASRVQTCMGHTGAAIHPLQAPYPLPPDQLWKGLQVIYYHLHIMTGPHLVGAEDSLGEVQQRREPVGLGWLAAG